MIEKRLTERLARYWEQISAGDHLPDIKRLNPERIQDLWPNCMKVEVVNANTNLITYTYVYVGNAMQTIYGKDLTGGSATSKMSDQPNWKLLKKVDLVIKDPQIMMEEGQFVNDNNKIVKFRACLLPFGTGEKVSHVVVGMSYKEF